MLAAIVHGKARRVWMPHTDQTVSWRDLFRQYEDLLTGAFFGRLRYLSEPMLTVVFERLIGHMNIASAGKVEDIEFWPNLTGLEDRSRVQPDLLITFEHATVLVEVKPPSGPRQSVDQWRYQLNAYLAECRSGRRHATPMVHFVAIGNSTAVNLDDFDFHRLGEAADLLDFAIHQIEWNDIAACVSTWLANGRRGEAQLTPSDIAVLADLEECLWLFGIKRRALLPWRPLSKWMEHNSLLLPDSILAPFEASTESPEQLNFQDKWATLATYYQEPLECRRWESMLTPQKK